LSFLAHIPFVRFASTSKQIVRKRLNRPLTLAEKVSSRRVWKEEKQGTKRESQQQPFFSLRSRACLFFFRSP